MSMTGKAPFQGRSPLRVELDYDDYERLSNLLHQVDLDAKEGATWAKVEQILALMRTRRHLEDRGTIQSRRIRESASKVS